MLLTSCQQDREVVPGVITTGPVDFTLDLMTPANAALRTAGGYVITHGVVVARAQHGSFVAATQTCSHEKKQGIIFQDNGFVCTVHGARFNTAGQGINNFGSRGLRIYNTAVNGFLLRVYS